MKTKEKKKCETSAICGVTQNTQKPKYDALFKLWYTVNVIQ